MVCIKKVVVLQQNILQNHFQISPGMPIPSGVRPFIEMMFNKNFYSGAPVIGIYEMRKLNELQVRPSTRKIAREMANGASNLFNFVAK